MHSQGCRRGSFAMHGRRREMHLLPPPQTLSAPSCSTSGHSGRTTKPMQCPAHVLQVGHNLLAPRLHGHARGVARGGRVHGANHLRADAGQMPVLIPGQL